MATLEKLTADLEKLKAARRSGVLRLRLDDREVFYRDDAELARQIAALETEIGTSSTPRTIAMRSTKGWQ
jgi:hypothetical protein